MITNEQNKEKNDYIVLTRLAAIEKMDITQLRKEWELYHNGAKAPNYGKQFLMRKLAFRIQETYYGGLSSAAAEKYRQVAETNPKNKRIGEPSNESTKNKSSDILPGTRFVRTWNGQRIEVITLEKGFQYNNQVYRSLSAIAKEVTGTNWNGKIFFGLKS